MGLDNGCWLIGLKAPNFLSSTKFSGVMRSTSRARVHDSLLKVSAQVDEACVVETKICVTGARCLVSIYRMLIQRKDMRIDTDHTRSKEVREAKHT